MCVYKLFIYLIRVLIIKYLSEYIVKFEVKVVKMIFIKLVLLKRLL